MAEATAGKKRKSKVAENEGNAVKKIKAEKSADRPTPLKSALKKTTKDTGKLSGKGVAVSDKKATTPKKAEPKVSAKKAVTDSKPKRNTTKTTKKAAANSEDQIPLDIASDNENSELTSDQTAALLAGFSSDEDEEEDDPSDTDAIPVSKIPSVPSKGLIQKRIRQAIAEQDDPETTPGVLYIGRLPHGFYEHQLKAYLSQFGEILHLRLARNKKTGKSQHYAFVEFASAAVAEIVAKTMDRYLLFNHLLQVRRVPKEQIKESMFRNADKRFKKAAPHNKIERGSLRRGMVREGWEKKVEKEEQKRKEKAEKLKELGYEFEMPSVKKVSEVPVKEKVDVVEAAEETKALPPTEEAVVEDAPKTKKGKKRSAAAVVEEEVVAPVVEEPVVQEPKKSSTKKTKKAADAIVDAPKAKKAKKSKA